jgi:transcriptional regulator with XRE-family HTH domain
MITIPEKISYIRKVNGLSLKAVGAILGKTAGAICNYEKGRRPIRAVDLEKLELLYPNNKK